MGKLNKLQIIIDVGIHCYWIIVHVELIITCHQYVHMLGYHCEEAEPSSSSSRKPTTKRI